MLDNLLGFHFGSATLLLRLVLGIIFVVHGYAKLFKDPGPKGTSSFLQSLKIPAPLFFAYVVGVVEFFGGVLVILGLLTRLAALLIAINMVVATWKVKFKTGLVTKVMEGGWSGGYELDLALFAIAVVLALLGGGRFAIDRLFL